MIKKSAIVDKATVAAQDARVKKMMKLETWFATDSFWSTVCSIERGWYPTPSEVYLLESKRRQGSAIDDRGVSGVMTEFVQHETDIPEGASSTT